jgi:hypothetical protein
MIPPTTPPAIAPKFELWPTTRMGAESWAISWKMCQSQLDAAVVEELAIEEDIGATGAVERPRIAPEAGSGYLLKEVG